MFDVAHTTTRRPSTCFARRAALSIARMAVWDPSVPTTIVRYPIASARREGTGHLPGMYVATEEVCPGGQAVHAIDDGFPARELLADEQRLRRGRVGVDRDVVGEPGVVVRERDLERTVRGGRETRHVESARRRGDLEYGAFRRERDRRPLLAERRLHHHQVHDEHEPGG